MRCNRLRVDRSLSKDCCVAKRTRVPADLATLVDHMFEQVMGEAERAELLACIKTWEAENPDVDSAHRVTAWIDIAYDVRSRANAGPRALSEVRIADSTPKARSTRGTFVREAIA